MARHLNALDGLTLSDLMTQDGVIFEIGDQYDENDKEEFSYSGNVELSNEEAINLLNMEEFQDEEEKDDSVTLCGMSFKALKRQMSDITGDGKVMKLVKQKGVGEIVPCNAQVAVTYVGYFEYSDEPFDSSLVRGDPETFRLGIGMLIPGLEIGIASMRKHEIAGFIIHPDLAFGLCGCVPRIPPNEEVLFVVRLKDFLDNGSADTFENLSVEEKKLFKNIVQGAQAMIVTGNNNFKKHKIKQAMREYQKAINWLENADLQNDEEEEEAKRLLSKAYSNLAVCCNKENMPRRACIACNSVPMPTAKTHFNHGRALLRMGEYSRAMEELQTSLKLEPNNKHTIQEIRLANEKHRKYLEIEKRIWGNCLKAHNEQKKPTLFENAAREMCETFAHDNELLRQPLPDGLTAEEDKYIRDHAAALGLSITTHQRYGKEITYLNKPNY